MYMYQGGGKEAPIYPSAPIFFSLMLFLQYQLIPTMQAIFLQIEVQVSTSSYLLSKVNSSGFSIGYIAEVTHGNPRFRFKLCDLNKVLG